MPPSEPPMTSATLVDAEGVEQAPQVAAAWSRVETAGKVVPIWRAGPRVDGGRTGRAVPATEQVGAQDADAVRVERPARPDEWLPPVAGRVGRAGQGVDDHDLRRRPRAPGRRAGTRRSARGGRPVRRAKGPSDAVSRRPVPVGSVRAAGGDVDRPRSWGRPASPGCADELAVGGDVGRGRVEGLGQVGDEVVDVLQADRQADEVIGDAGRSLLLGLQLRVRGRGGVDDERLGVADVGQQAEDLDVVDEPAPGLDAALDAERDDAAEAALEVLAWPACTRDATRGPDS